MELFRTYFGNKAVDETANATIFPYRSAFSDKEEIKVAQIFFNFAAGYIAQIGHIDTVSFANRQLELKLKILNLNCEEH